MAGQYDGGILSGMLNGWRMGEDDHRTRVEFQARQADAALQRQRQQAADARAAQQFSWEVEDRPGEVAFRNDERNATRDHWSRGATLFGQGQEDRARDLARQPVLDARDDERHALDVASRRQQLGFAAENQADQRRGRQRVWDEASLRDEIDNATRTIAPAFMRGAGLGDWGGLKDAWNATMGQHGAKVDAIEQGPNGQIGVLVNGKQKIFDNADALQAFIANALDPTDAFSAMAESRKQRMAGGDRPPAVIQAANEIFARVPRMSGESDNERWVRSLAMANGYFNDATAGRGASMAGAGSEDSLPEYQPQETSAFANVDFRGSGPSTRGGSRRPAPNSGPPPEGTRVRGPDGRTYVVRDGKPVPVN